MKATFPTIASLLALVVAGNRLTDDEFLKSLVIDRGLPPQRALQLRSLTNADLNTEDRAARTAGYYQGLLNGGADAVATGFLSHRADLVNDHAGIGRAFNARLTGDFLWYDLKPNLDAPSPAGRLLTNSQGMADQEYPIRHPQDTWRVALLGDSLIRGWGTNPGRAFETLLENKLNADHRPQNDDAIEILNFGVDGYCLTQVMECAITRVPQYDPDAYVVSIGALAGPKLWTKHLAGLVREGADLKYEFLRDLAAEADLDPYDPPPTTRAKLAPYHEPVLRFALERLRDHADLADRPLLVLLTPVVEPPTMIADDFVGVVEALTDLGIRYIDLRGAFTEAPSLEPAAHLEFRHAPQRRGTRGPVHQALREAPGRPRSPSAHDRTMIADGALIHVAFLAVYLFALIGVGVYKARSVKTQEDFSLAGRGLGPVVLVGTLLATWIGTGSIFGNAQETYRVGVAAFLLPVSAVVGIVALYFLAPRIRRFGKFTIQDILEARFGPWARILGTITLILAYVIIVSYQYRAGSAVLERMAPGLGHVGAVCAVAFFVILYTALAGMISVAYTDVANGILMTLGLALALPILLSQAGGIDGALTALEPGQRDFFGAYSVTQLLSVLLPAFLLLLGDANMVQRFFAARDPGSARSAAKWMLVGVVVLECAIIAVALLGVALVGQGELSAPENTGHIVVHLAFEALPPVLGALLIATVVAIVVSTADSYLLAPATSITRDIYQRFLAPDATETRIVFVSRLVVVGLGLIALGLAFTSDQFFGVALFAYTIYGAGITPALIAAYFWRRATSAGAVASMLTGVGTALVWKALTTASVQERLGDSVLADLGRWATAKEVDAVLPAVALSILVLIVVSLLTSAPDEAHARAF